MTNQGFLRKGLVYLASSLLIQVFNLILLPLYAKNFSASEFGELTIIITFQSILLAFSSLGVLSGFTRFYWEYPDQNRLKNIALTFSGMWGAVVILIATVSSHALAPVVFNHHPDSARYLVLIAVNAVILGINNTYATFFSMRYAALRSSIITLANLVLTIFGTYWMVICWKQGVRGAIEAQTMAYTAVFLFLILADIRTFRFTLDIPKLKKMLSYGLGLLPGQLSFWLFSLIDRYLLQGFAGLSTVGVYAMGYKIGLLIQPVFINPFTTLFTPFRFEVYKESDGRRKIRRMFEIYNFTGWLVILGLALFANPMIIILATTEYHAAYQLVPLFAFSYFLCGLGNFYELGLHIANKMLVNSLITILGVIVNFIFNYLAISRWGMFGAAWATVFTFLLMNTAYYFCGRRYYKLDIHLYEPFKYLIVFLAVYLPYLLIKPHIHNLWVEMIISVALMAVYLMINLFIRFIPDHIIQFAHSGFSKTSKKVKILLNGRPQPE